MPTSNISAPLLFISSINLGVSWGGNIAVVRAGNAKLAVLLQHLVGGFGGYTWCRT